MNSSGYSTIISSCKKVLPGLLFILKQKMMILHRKKINCLFLFAIFFSGCVRYHPQPIFADKTLGDFEERTLDAAELKEFFRINGQTPEWPMKSWDIKALTLVSLFYHPDLDVARAQWGVTQAGRITAGERPNPDFSFAPTYNSSIPVGEGTRWSPGFSLDITIETAGKRGIRIARARQFSEAAYLNIHTVAWQVYSRLRQSVLELYGAEQACVLLNERQSALAANTAIAEAQHAAGAISAYQVAQLRIAMQSSRLDLFEAEKARSQAWVKLAAAMGVPFHVVKELPIHYDEFERYDVKISEKEARLHALTARNDILSALAEYAAAQSSLRLEVARQYPDIHLGPGYQLDQSQNKWTLGITFNLPIFSRNRGPIAEAEARRSEAAARFLALQASILSEIDSALAGIKAALPQAEAAEELLNNLQKQEKTAAAMHEIGEISKADLLALRLELNTAYISRLNALIKAQEAIGAFENAVQSALELSPEQLQVAPSRSKR
ncbi:MAG: TolC family protein [Candidatus Aminicenantes bacterium]|nr:TolC family protein [Candidatus Aminicenantes bacterium]